MKKLIPRFLKPTLRKLYYLVMDAVDRIRGRAGMTAPRSINFIGGGDFDVIGREFKKYFIDLAGLKTGDRVLDVGCGLGRMAIPLTDYLTGDGEYYGFDIVKKGIRWCQKRIASRFGNFHFQHSDVYNKYYNPKGKEKAIDYVFPFDDAFFDFVFLTSVFTHMLPADVENYLGQISRVLKPGGRCLLTFFILNEEAKKLVQSGRSALDFKYDMKGYTATDRKVPESAVAFEEAYVLSLFERNGLRIIHPVYYGFWCGRDRVLTYQDLIVAEKSPPSTRI